MNILIFEDFILLLWKMPIEIMGKTKEQLETEVLDIQKEILALKNTVNQAEKQTRLDAVEKKISCLQGEIEASVALSEAEKTAILQSLETTSSSLSELENEILGNDVEEVGEESKKPEVIQEKGFWDKTKDMWNEGR